MVCWGELIEGEALTHCSPCSEQIILQEQGHMNQEGCNSHSPAVCGKIQTWKWDNYV